MPELTPSPFDSFPWPVRLERWIHAACLLEAAAPKPGNVHPQASFSDLTYDDFRVSAAAVAPVLARAGEKRVGATILEAIQATRNVTDANTNLGIILLLAPLAAVPENVSLADGVAPVLGQLSHDDAVHAYAAIRLAKAGGLSTKPAEDIESEPTVTLLEAMQLAAEYDTIASEYANNFRLVLTRGLYVLGAATDFEETWKEAIIRLQLSLMALEADTLIARKCNLNTAETASQMAREILEVGFRTDSGRQKLADFDKWLRADGNRRNPGTTADLVCATLFAAFREGILPVPELPA